MITQKHRGIAVGGTFDTIHAGHRNLIERAFSTGAFVFIGLTSDEYVSKAGKKIEHDFQTRKAQLESFLLKNYPSTKYIIVRLDDRFGPGIFTSSVEAIVVSTETLPVVEEANKRRRSVGLPDLKVEVVPISLAEDGKRISGTRIRAGEIDSEGHLRQH